MVTELSSRRRRLRFSLKFDSETLCNMIRQIVNLDYPGNFAAVYEAALKWATLWQRFKGVFEGIPLASEDARQLRNTHEMVKREERNMLLPLTPPPAQQVAEQLAMFEAGVLARMVATEPSAHPHADKYLLQFRSSRLFNRGNAWLEGG